MLVQTLVWLNHLDCMNVCEIQSVCRNSKKSTEKEFVWALKVYVGDTKNREKGVWLFPTFSSVIKFITQSDQRVLNKIVLNMDKDTLWFTNLILLGFDTVEAHQRYNIQFTSNMFHVANIHGMEHVVHFFLECIFTPQKIANVWIQAFLLCAFKMHFLYSFFTPYTFYYSFFKVAGQSQMDLQQKPFRNYLET